MWFPRAVDRPRELPELRAALLELARPNGPIHLAEVERARADAMVLGLDVMTGDLAGMKAARWHYERLAEAQLVYVSAEMVDYVSSVAETVPPDLTIAMADAPAPAMLVVLAKPIYGTDSISDDVTVRVDGMIIGGSMLPPRDTPLSVSFEEGTPCVTASMLRMVAPEHDDLIAVGVERVMWLPLGRSDWPEGDRLDTPTLPGIEPGSITWRSMMEDRRFIAALFGVMNQRLLTESQSIYPDKAVRRRLARGGSPGRNEVVQVVHLRRRAYVAADADPTGRHVGVRYRVRQHWRRQACGPGRSERRLVLVPSHWRGPDDAPLSDHSTIWSLDT